MLLEEGIWLLEEREDARSRGLLSDHEGTSEE
jgi:hypothetical protein